MKKTILHLLEQMARYRPLLAGLSLAGMLLVGGCEKVRLQPEATNSPAASKGVNPFSVAIMQQAYNNLLAKNVATVSKPAAPKTTTTYSKGEANRPLPDPTTEPDPQPQPTPTNPSIQPTHWYLRFKPANTDQIADLGDLGFNLSWVPFDESMAAYTTLIISPIIFLGYIR